MGFYKGQGAAEYLILLAVVLIIALVGILLLGGVTSGGGDARDTESKAYWGGASPFSFTEWTQINDTLYLTMVNRDNSRLILRQMQLGNVTSDFGAGWTMGPQSSKTITITGFQMCNLTTYDSFSYPITITYDSEAISNRTQIGTKPIAGRCSFP